MAGVEYNLQQRKIGLQKYITAYGIELLNKLAQEKKGVDILEMTTTDLSNLKKTLDAKGFKDFIKANERLPTVSEARSLGHQSSDIRAAEKLKYPERIIPDTSPVYNKAEGYIYKRGGGGGNQGQVVYAKTKGGNQYTAIKPMRSFEELQKAINDAPKLELPKGSGNFFLQNAKDITGTSSKSTKEIITAREALEYDGTIDEVTGKLKRKLIYPGSGRKQVEQKGIAGRLNRKNKIGPAQGGEMTVKGGKEIGKAFGHVYPIIESAKPGTKTTNIIDSKMNNKLIGFNRIGQKIAEDQEWYIKNKPQNYIEEIEKLNGKAKLNVNNAIEKLGPKYKGEIGYFLVNPETGEFTPKAGNYKNSIAGLEGENQIYKSMTGDERKLASEDIAKKARDLFQNRSLQEATIPGSPICNLPSVVKRNADGGRIAFANGSNCAIEVGEAFEKNPKGFAQEVNKLPEEAGAFNRVKSAASKFLNVAKKGGRFGAFAAVGAVGAGLVKQFTSDDPTSYLSNEDQQKNMLIDMVTEPVMEKTDPGITSSAQLPVLGAVTAAGAIPGAAEYYKDRRGIRPNDKFTGPMQKGVGKIRAAASPISGLLGKGLAATGTPLGMLALEPLYIGQQLAEGDSVGDIATNPLNYLGAAFAAPLTQQATKFASPAVSSFMRLGISPGVLKTVSRRFGLPGLALSAGISGYEMYQNKKAGRGLFDDG